jgi:cell division protein FtsA
VLSDILQPRAEELCHLVLQEIRRAGYERVLNSGVVVAGGSAALEGLPEVAERIFDMPIRRGLPTGVGGLVDVVASPAYATAVGLVLYGQRSRAHRLHGRERGGANSFGRVAARVREWLQELV